MKKIIFVVCLSLLVVPQIGSAGVVPCGLTVDDPDQPGDQTVPCNICHLFVMGERIVDLVLFKIVPPIAILVAAIAGFMFIFGGGADPGLIGQARSILRSLLIGMAIVYGAWILVNTFLTFIGLAEFSPLKEWFVIKCQP